MISEDSKGGLYTIYILFISSNNNNDYLHFFSTIPVCYIQYHEKNVDILICKVRVPIQISYF